MSRRSENGRRGAKRTAKPNGRRNAGGIGIVAPNTGPRSSLAKHHKDKDKNKELAHLMQYQSGVEKMTCPRIMRWSKAMDAGMQVPDNDVKIPLPGDESLSVSKSMALTNTGQLEIDGFNSELNGATIYCYPDGAAGSNTVFSPVGLTDGGKPVIIGANLGGPDSANGIYPTAIGMLEYNGTTAGYATLKDSRFSPSRSGEGCFPLTFDDYDAVSLEEYVSDLQNRSTVLTVEVSLISDLQNTRGGVRCWNPDFWPGEEDPVYRPTGGSGAAAPLLSSGRRDASYVDYEFSAKRSRVFRYAPAPQSIKYGDAGIGTNTGYPPYKVNGRVCGSRFVIQVYGLTENETIFIRFISSMEYRGTHVNALTTPSYMTPDIAHLANAIPRLSNYPTGGSKPPTLAEHVVHQKVIASPHAKALAESKGIDTEDVKKTAKAGHSIFSDIMKGIDTVGAFAALL